MRLPATAPRGLVRRRHQAGVIEAGQRDEEDEAAADDEGLQVDTPGEVWCGFPARPIGVHSLESQATTTAMTAAMTATGRARSAAEPAPWPRLSPRPRRAGRSACSRRVWRPRAWPRKISAATASATASALRAVDS